MNKIFYIFIFLSFCFPSYSFLTTNKCQKSFKEVHSLKQILDSVNTENNYFLFKDQYQHDLLNLNSKKVGYFNRMLNSFKQSLGLKYDVSLSLYQITTKYPLDSIQSLREVESLTKLILKTFYPRSLNFEDFFLFNQRKRIRLHNELIIREQLIFEGIREYWSVNSIATQSGIRLSLFKFFDKLHFSEFLLDISQKLAPALVPKKLPSSLIQKIIWNGSKAHELEILELYPSLSIFEFTHQFKKFFFSVFMGTLISVSVIDVSETIIAAKIEAEHKTGLEVKQISRNMEIRNAKRSQHTNRKINDIIDKAIKGTIKEFIQKWGEEPTPKELELIRKRVITQLKLENYLTAAESRS